jgi:hypothetical protein
VLAVVHQQVQLVGIFPFQLEMLALVAMLCFVLARVVLFQEWSMLLLLVFP